MSSTSVSAVKSKSVPISSISCGRRSVIERLDQVAGVGFVQFADQRAQQAGIAPGDRLGDRLDELGPDRAVVVAQTIGRSVGGCGDVLFVDHAGPRWTRDCAESPACTPGQ